ncbi:MAG: SMC-Scp complex subunit ScpB, partial [Spirochaetaceae bacterium]|nr:SMC-Scp complex subunit ScpB [Spirochaetaceae bacterium]
ESEPQSEAVLVRNSELSKDVVDMALQQLKEKYSAADSGIELIQISGGWTLSPKRELWDFLKERYGKKSEGKLSRAAMETLSIIAYSQPITRAEIEAIRGVSADNMIRLLVERSLIKEVGKKDVPGKPVQFGTTKEFLKFFRLNSIADLPRLDDAESERFELAR